MFTRTSFFAFATAAVLGAAVASAPASARAFVGGHGGHVSMSHVSMSHVGMSRVGGNRFSNLNRSFARPGMRKSFTFHKPSHQWGKNKWTKNWKWGKNKWKWYKWAKWHHRHHRWFGYGIYAYGAPSYVYSEPTYVAPAPAAYSTPAPVASNCNCLTKHYENGAVIFEDVCTHEGAISTPQDQAQAQAPAQ